MRKKALIVGIDHYEHTNNLYGCVNDARSVKNILERHADGTTNFVTPLLLTGSDPNNLVSKQKLKQAIRELFEDNPYIALMYFAGHGHIQKEGGYIIASDSSVGDEGISLAEILGMANRSPAKNKVIVLDSCHSGVAGIPHGASGNSELAEGLTILTASTAEQYASEQQGSGVFTTLFVDALNGAASNLVGDITLGSIYAHIDQSLGEWKQRPIFKTNVQSFVSIRKIQPQISISDLHQLKSLFPHAGCEVRLDPSFEPERPEISSVVLPEPNPENTRIFAVLQRYNRLNLLVPVDAPHMYHAAIESKSCKLTALGEHYRRLVEDDLI